MSDPTLPSGHRRSVRLAHLFGLRDAGRVLRDFSTYLPGQAASALAGVLVLPVLARSLDPEDFGALALAQTLVTFGAVLAGGWLTQVVVRELPSYRAAGRLDSFARTLRHGFAWTSALFVLFVAILGVVAISFATLADLVPLVIAAAAALIVQNVGVMMFAASLQPRSSTAVDVLGRTSGIVLGALLVLAGLGAGGYLLGISIGAALFGAIGLFRAWPKTEPAVGAEATASSDVVAWLRYGIPVSVAALASWAFMFVDRYLLAALEDTASVGVYTLGSVLGERAVMIPALAFFAGAQPLLVTAYEQRGTAEFERLMRSYTGVLATVGMPTVALLAVVADDLVAVVGGRGYDDATAVVPLVALAAFFYGLALIGSMGLVAAKRSWPIAAAAMLGLVVNVAANLLLIPPFGVTGAAIAAPLGTAAYAVISYRWARSHARWEVSTATLTRAVLSSAAAAAAALGASTLADSDVTGLVLGIAAGGLTYLAALAASGGLAPLAAGRRRSG